ncbi:MAG: DUF3825 domain-containing protein [Bacteroidota bacterium]
MENQELGIVSFFHVERGFGRIKSPEHPNGVFVHFTDVQSDARILIPNEMVHFQLGESPKGPKAVGVQRLTERQQGQITQFEHGFGFLKARETTYFFHHTDLLGEGFKQVRPGMEVEFSSFEADSGWQAKEIILVDPRSPLERFGWLGTYERQLQRLVRMAEPEAWEYHRPTQQRYPILRSYIDHTFRRLEEQGGIRYASDQEGEGLACFNTGLLSRQQEEIFAFFGANRRRLKRSGYLKPQEWVLRGFGVESNRLRSHFSSAPPLATYVEEPAELVFDGRLPLVPDYEHILKDRKGRLPDRFLNWPANQLAERFRDAIHLVSQQLKRNYRLAVPQYYEGQIQLLVPLCLELPNQPDLALVISREHEIYRANTILPLEWAYQNARLIAPQTFGWLSGWPQKA